jgi:hypothetical protein
MASTFISILKGLQLNNTCNNSVPTVEKTQSPLINPPVNYEYILGNNRCLLSVIHENINAMHGQNLQSLLLKNVLHIVSNCASFKC